MSPPPPPPHDSPSAGGGGTGGGRLPPLPVPPPPPPSATAVSASASASPRPPPPPANPPPSGGGSGGGKPPRINSNNSMTSPRILRGLFQKWSPSMANHRRGPSVGSSTSERSYGSDDSSTGKQQEQQNISFLNLLRQESSTSSHQFQYQHSGGDESSTEGGGQQQQEMTPPSGGGGYTHHHHTRNPSSGSFGVAATGGGGGYGHHIRDPSSSSFVYNSGYGYHTRDQSSGSYFQYQNVCPTEVTPLVGTATRKKDLGNSNYYSTDDDDASDASSLNTGLSSSQLTNAGSGSYLIRTFSTNSDDNYIDMDVEDNDDRSVSTTSTFSTVSSLAENFRDSLMIPFTDEEGTRTKIMSGLAALAVVGTIAGLIMPKNTRLPQSWGYQTISSVIGYNYFVLWSVCFYPQVLLNYRRKSTKGLSPDFCCLNLMGWTFYALYLSAMYFSPHIRNEYSTRFHESSSVASNDVAFAVHAAILSMVYIIQIMWYHKTDDQKKSKSKSKSKPSDNNNNNNNNCCSPFLHMKLPSLFLLYGMGIPAITMPTLIVVGIWAESRWLDYFYILSFFKIGCTLTKYTKQVNYNYKRKSTKGWNIWYNFLECSGGSLSMIQICLDSWAMGELSGITGNFAKFLLGFATIFFDMLFFMQHYVWYPDINNEEGDDDDIQVGGLLIDQNDGKAKPLPKHIRASSRFEIVIPLNQHDDQQQEEHHHLPTIPSYQEFGGGSNSGRRPVIHSESSLSLGDDDDDDGSYSNKSAGSGSAVGMLT